MARYLRHALGRVADMTDDAPIILTPEEAISLLAAGEIVHNYANPTHGMFIGVDYSREYAEQHIRDAFAREIAGPNCKRMKHALAVWKNEDDRRPTFFETDAEKVEMMEASKQKVKA
jgi:hypothetical protein